MFVLGYELPRQENTALQDTTRQCECLWSARLPKYACQFIEMCLMVTADHGPAVSGAHNTIVCARAGKDLISSLTSGLLTIVSNLAIVSFQVALKKSGHHWAYRPGTLVSVLHSIPSLQPQPRNSKWSMLTSFLPGPIQPRGSEGEPSCPSGTLRSAAARVSTSPCYLARESVCVAIPFLLTKQGDWEHRGEPKPFSLSEPCATGWPIRRELRN